MSAAPIASAATVGLGIDPVVYFKMLMVGFFENAFRHLSLRRSESCYQQLAQV
jgi:hypothetical protein